MKAAIVQGFENYTVFENGVVINTVTNKRISVSVMKVGYPSVRLWNKGKTKLFTMHRLLAIHFIPNPENKREVNHIDGNKLNYQLSNLEWATPSENMKHCYRAGLSNGTYKSGYNHRLRKLSREAVAYIIEQRKHKLKSLKELSQQFGVTPDHICKISKNKIKNMIP